MNSVILIGNLASDVELREFGEDKRLATFRLAVDRGGKDAEADFFRIAARYRDWVARSPHLRRFVFGFVSVADPIALSNEAVEGFLAAHLLHTDVDGAWQALRVDDPRQELEAIRCPVLVLWGAEDVQLPLDDAFEYTRRLRARLRVIPGCGHLLIGERPDACDRAIKDFLEAGSLRDGRFEGHHLPA